jgi:ELWxxDGT repeat protein
MHRSFSTTPWVFLPLFVCFLALPLPTGWAAEEANLVLDIFPGLQESDLRELTNVNGTLFFAGSDGVHDLELWKSDGTAAGTVLVKDINSSMVWFGAAVPKFLTNVNGTLFFSANDGVHGVELWTSDGTAAGTVLVQDIYAGVESSEPGGNPPDSSGLLNVNGTLFFAANDGVHGVELWKSDGTAAGTVLVKDIDSGIGFGNSFPQELTNVNGTLFFTADDGVHGFELWKSDGTEAGTVLVKDINPIPGPSDPPEYLTNVNGTLHFAANDGVHGTRLWKSDGTTAGTVLVQNIGPGSPFNPEFLTNVNGTLFFAAGDGVQGVELWKSDGTAAGTVLVKDIFAGAGSSLSSLFYSPSLININGTLFFNPRDLDHGIELWKSDGTAAGTVLVKDIYPGTEGPMDPDPISSAPSFLTNVNGTLFFSAEDGVHGRELWNSDGTVAGTVLVQDIYPGGGSSEPGLGLQGGTPSGLTNVNGTLFFDANDGVHGRELWKLPVVSPSLGDPHDFNGDGNADIVWRNTSDGNTAIWFMNGITMAASAFPGGVPVAWQIAGVGDVNGDGKADVIWHHGTSGTVAVWLMNGATVTALGFPGSAPTDWAIQAIGDGDGDGKADLVWRNTSDGNTGIWFMNGTVMASSSFPGGVPVAWQIAGVGDVNGDGKADVIWHHGTSGTVAIWLMNGATVTAVGFPGSAPTPWSMQAVGDVDGDRKADLVWRNTSDGNTAIWFMNGTTMAASAFPGGVPLAWQIEQVADVNGNGKADVIWRNSTSGTVAVWLMNGSVVDLVGFPGSAPTEWEIQP